VQALQQATELPLQPRQKASAGFPPSRSWPFRYPEGGHGDEELHLMYQTYPILP
jgi:hypothetical protein